MSNVAAFRGNDEQVFTRGDDVVLRTGRGLELGVIKETELTGSALPAGGTVLRHLDRQDQLLRERLERNHDAAMTACSDALAVSHPDLLLVDAEVLFDGQTLLFYFLGDLTAEEELAITADLTEVYQQASGLDEFAKTMIEGCGPDCGTGESGCGTGESSGGCSNCSTGCGLKNR